MKCIQLTAVYATILYSARHRSENLRETAMVKAIFVICGRAVTPRAEMAVIGGVAVAFNHASNLERRRRTLSVEPRET